MLIEKLKAHFDSVELSDELHKLWGDCGAVIKAEVNEQLAVIKYSCIPTTIKHPHISQTPFAKARKAKSYCVERSFYQRYVCHLPCSTLTPELLLADQNGAENILVFKDFSVQGFHAVTEVDLDSLKQVIAWLARFHATFIWCDNEPEHINLWQQGGYWHLATRPDEFENMAQSDIKFNATKLEDILVNQTFKTLIHGDAKLANFAINGHSVIGYDFQYVGKGVGLQDIMLLFTSVFDSEQLYLYEKPLLAFYFSELNSALENKFEQDMRSEIEHQWRRIWPVIWSDFYRFLLGWNPNHVKINHYMREQASRVLSEEL
jgi:hypothetical protein